MIREVTITCGRLRTTQAWVKPFYLPCSFLCYYLNIWSACVLKLKPQGFLTFVHMGFPGWVSAEERNHTWEEPWKIPVPGPVRKPGIFWWQSPVAYKPGPSSMTHSVSFGWWHKTVCKIQLCGAGTQAWSDRGFNTWFKKKELWSE